MVNTNLLRAKMVANGYTQLSLAAKMKMSKNTLSAKITGKTAFSIDEAIALCDILHIEQDSEKCEIFLPDASH